MTKTASPTPDVIKRVISALEELADQDRARALRAVSTYFDDDTDEISVPTRETRPADFTRSPSNFSAERGPSPKQFIFEKQPRTDVERMACLAYYLTHYRDTPHFKTVELTKLNTEAAQSKFSNPSVTAANALKCGYLAEADRGKRQLAAAGERYVEALPDRATASGAMKQHRKKVLRKASGRGPKK